LSSGSIRSILQSVGSTSQRCWARSQDAVSHCFGEIYSCRSSRVTAAVTKNETCETGWDDCFANKKSIRSTKKS
jgi:hypothetical protein